MIWQCFPGPVKIVHACEGVNHAPLGPGIAPQCDPELILTAAVVGRRPSRPSWKRRVCRAGATSRPCLMSPISHHSGVWEHIYLTAGAMLLPAPFLAVQAANAITGLKLGNGSSSALQPLPPPCDTLTGTRTL